MTAAVHCQMAYSTLKDKLAVLSAPRVSELHAEAKDPATYPRGEVQALNSRAYNGTKNKRDYTNNEADIIKTKAAMTKAKKSVAYYTGEVKKIELRKLEILEALGSLVNITRHATADTDPLFAEFKPHMEPTTLLGSMFDVTLKRGKTSPDMGIPPRLLSIAGAIFRKSKQGYNLFRGYFPDLPCKTTVYEYDDTVHIKLGCSNKNLDRAEQAARMAPDPVAAFKGYLMNDDMNIQAVSRDFNSSNDNFTIT